MKKITLLFVLLLSLQVFSQETYFNYKVLITDTSGTPLLNQAVDIRIGIYDEHPLTGNMIFQETHHTTTDSNGIVVLNIGSQNPTGWDALDWTHTGNYLKVEMDTGGGYQQISVSPLNFVPYAKYSLKSKQVEQVDFGQLTGVPTGLSDGDDVNDADHDATNELQTLSVSGTQLTISNGNTVTLPTGSGGDQWGSQVVQTNSSLNGDGTSANPLGINTSDTVFNGWDKNAADDFSGNFNDLSNIPTGLSDGDDVNDADHDPTNEIQTISKSDNMVTLSNGGGSFVDSDTHLTEAQVDAYVSNNGYLTTETDGSNTNELQTLSVSGNQLSISNGNTVNLPDQTDADFYTVGTTTPPSANTDDIFHLGKLVIGKNTVDDGSTNQNAKVEIQNPVSDGSHPSYVLKTERLNTGAGAIGNILAISDYSGNFYFRAINNQITGNGTGNVRGIENRINISGDGKHYGTYNYLTGSGSGNKYGSYNVIASYAGGTHYAVYGKVNKTGSYAGYFEGSVAIKDGTEGNGKIFTSDADGKGSWQDVSAWDTDASDDFSGDYNDLTNVPVLFNKMGGTNPATSIQDPMYHNGALALGGVLTNSNQAMLTTVQSSNNVANMYGILNSGNLSGSTSLYTIYNKISGSEDGNSAGVYNSFLTNGNGNQYGIYNHLNNTGSGEHYGIYSLLNNENSAQQFGVRNYISGTGTGDKYSLYSHLEGKGRKYGVYTEIIANNTSEAIGMKNRIIGNGGNTHRGIVNYLLGSGLGLQIAVDNSIDNTGNGGTGYDHIGVRNSISGSGGNKHKGVYNTLWGSADVENIGVENMITNSGNGPHIGIKTTLTGTGTGEKFGTYIKIDKNAGGQHYGIFSQVEKANGFAGFFIGKTEYYGYMKVLPQESGQVAKITIKNTSGDADIYIDSHGTNNPSTQYYVDNNYKTSSGYNVSQDAYFIYHGGNVFVKNGNILPEGHRLRNLGASGNAWNNVYAHNYVTQGSAAYTDRKVTEELIKYAPKAKKDSDFDAKDNGLYELNPQSLPANLHTENGLKIDEIATYNYKANYEQQIIINRQQKQIDELKQIVEKQQKMIEKLLINK